MKLLQYSLSRIFILIVLWTSCSLAHAEKVTLTEVGKPLRLIVQKLSDQTGSEITVDKSLQDRKLVCVLHDVSEEDVLQQTARVLGAQVTRKDGIKRQYVLALKPEVTAWSHAYIGARDDAFRRAVADTADYTFNKIQNELANVPPTTDVGRLSHLMPSQAWRALADTYAASVDGLGLTISDPSRALYLREFSDLSSTDQETVRGVLDKLDRTNGDIFLKGTAKTYVAVSLRFGHDPTVGIGLREPDGKAGRGYPFDLPISITDAIGVRDKQQKRYIDQWLNKHPVPSVSVLDFMPSGFVVPDKAIQAQDNAVPLPAVDPFPVGGATRTELLRLLGKTPSLNVIADYYTDDALLKEAGNDTLSTLNHAAQAFGCVWERHGNWLLSRQVNWVEKDVTEAPYPIFEQCFATRFSKGDTITSATNLLIPNPILLSPKGDLLLPLSMFLQVCSLPHEQFKHLAQYRGKSGTPLFLELWNLLNQRNSPTLEYRKYGLLSTVPIKQLTSATGVPVSRGAEGIYDELNKNALVHATLYAPLPPDARVRLVYYPAPKSDTDMAEGWQMEILSGSDNKVMVAVESFPAAPPKPSSPLTKTNDK